MAKTIQKDDELNFLGINSAIEGQMQIGGNLRIDGKIKGIIRCEGSLVLGENGYIEGELYATEAIIGGKVNGKLLIKNKLTLEAKSEIIGEFTCARLSIDEGAIFHGKASMKSEQDESK
jgi:cytoskeletal protein CcmA (bactofilin family)